MTKTEILEKIDKGLRGQGNQVDIGNVLADILTEIAEKSALIDDVIVDMTEYSDAQEISEEITIKLNKAAIVKRGDVFYSKVNLYDSHLIDAISEAWASEGFTGTPNTFFGEIVYDTAYGEGFSTATSWIVAYNEGKNYWKSFDV